MGAYGGLIQIMIYASFIQTEIESQTLITEDSFDILTEDSFTLLTETLG